MSRRCFLLLRRLRLTGRWLSEWSPFWDRPIVVERTVAFVLFGTGRRNPQFGQVVAHPRVQVAPSSVGEN